MYPGRLQGHSLAARDDALNQTEGARVSAMIAPAKQCIGPLKLLW